ncbi:MAG: hypothetical protein QOF02_1771 [Blastocatellia bacterium]|jgi:hypothetical protein|nr:hypothetical protein [Blastocatellia bacterium]
MLLPAFNEKNPYDESSRIVRLKQGRDGDRSRWRKRPSFERASRQALNKEQPPCPL